MRLWQISLMALSQIAEALVNAGYGNVCRHRQTLIELYLKGKTDELLKFIMEEV